MRRLRPEPVHWCQVTDDVRQYLCQQPTGLLRINAQLLGNLSDLSATQGLHDLLSRYGQVLTQPTQDCTCSANPPCDNWLIRPPTPPCWAISPSSTCAMPAAPPEAELEFKAAPRTLSNSPK